jgi:hypothetical protein
MLRSRNSRLLVWGNFVGAVLFVTSFAAFGQTHFINVVVSPPDGGTVTGAGDYPDGTNVPFFVQAAQGWYIRDITESPVTDSFVAFFHIFGGNRQTNVSGTVLVDRDKTFTVVFAPPIHIGIAAIGLGTVISEPTGPLHMNGTTVKLTATAKEPWHFLGWSGDVQNVLDNPLEITANNDMEIDAVFGQTVPVDIPPSSGNWMPQYVVPGQNVRVTVFPFSGYAFDHWEAPGIANSLDLDLPVTTNTIPPLRAVLQPVHDDEGSLVFYANKGGHVEIATETIPVKIGAPVVVTAVPDPGRTFVKWSNSAYTNNPLHLIATRQLYGAAVFSAAPLTLSVNGMTARGTRLRLHAEPNDELDAVEIERSGDLSHWTSYMQFPNTGEFVTGNFTVPLEGSNVFYRAVRR